MFVLPAGAVVVFTALPIALLWLNDPPSPLNPKTGVAVLPLEASPNPMLMGKVAAGHSATATILLCNRGADVITVQRVDTSCPCLMVGPAPGKIPPGQLEHLAVTFDAGQDPEFRGTLSIELTGRDPDAVIVFRAHVRVEVTGADMAAMKRTPPSFARGIHIF